MTVADVKKIAERLGCQVSQSTSGQYTVLNVDSPLWKCLNPGEHNWFAEWLTGDNKYKTDAIADLCNRLDNLESLTECDSDCEHCQDSE